MKFRTEIDIPKSKIQLSYSDRFLFIGSCFSSNIYSICKKSKFDTASNSHGIVYNPISMALQLNEVLDAKVYSEKDLSYNMEQYISFSHHGDFSNVSANQALEGINAQIGDFKSMLETSQVLFVTFGTSWYYQKKDTGQTVSNCHKVPAKEFRQLLGHVDDMTDLWEQLLLRLKKFNPDLQIVFSISPVRHFKDGSFNNNLSKGRLFDVIHNLNHKFDNTSYFPAYEIVLDELRDYRFFNSDLLHPSDEAIAYIWEKFQSTFLSFEAQKTLEKVTKLISSAHHRPLNPNTEAHKKFVLKTIDKIKALEQSEGLNFSSELDILKSS